MDQLQDAIIEIKKLRPHPWTDNQTKAHTIVIPEIIIQKIEGKYKVILKNEYLPSLKISRHYLQMLENPSTSAETKEYIKQKVLKANTIIKNIHQRQETIKKIAEIIIDTQYDFFEKRNRILKTFNNEGNR